MNSKTRHGLVLASLLAMTSAACRPTPQPPEGTGAPPPAKAAAETAAAASPSAAPVSGRPAPAELLADLREIITTALAAGEKTIVVPPGRYRVDPENGEHLRLAGLENVTLVMDGVEMVCTETTRAITIENCRNLTLRGLTIDYDPLPFTQGRIVEISDDTSRLTLDILEGYPEPGEVSGSMEIFDPETGQLRERTTHFGATSRMESPMRAIITKRPASEEFAIERVGDIAVISVTYAPGGRQPHAIMATDSEGLVFEDVTLYAGPTFGFFENGCNGSRYIRCRVDRRAPEHDPVVREMPRLRSMNADAYHSKNARRGPTYESCTAFFMGDDAIAINGDFHFVSKAEGAELRVLAKRVVPARPGDTVQFLNADGVRLPDRRVVSVKPDGAITEEERKDLLSRNLNPDLSREAFNDAYRIVLEEPVEGVARGTVICDSDGIGNGFAIRNCKLGHNRSRGILVKAGRGEITDNEITGAVMTSIMIAPEYWWFEAGMADDLLIARNRISEGRGVGIAVVSIGRAAGTISPAGTFNKITIADNTVQGGPSPGLLVTSVRGLVEKDNVINPDPAMALHPRQVGPWGKEGVQPVMRVNVEAEAPAP